MLRRGFAKIQIRHFAKKAQKQKKSVVAVSSDSYDMEKLRSQFTRTMTGFEKEMSKLRSGRPDASMLNHIQVDAYGDKQPLPSVGQVVLKSEREITINVFDASIKDDVAKAISTAGMDMNPQIDGNVVRVPIPKTTRETRESLIKVASTQTEKTKQRMLKIRREGISKLKKMKTDKTIGEDEFFTLQQEVQEISDKFTKDISELYNEKETSLRND